MKNISEILKNAKNRNRHWPTSVGWRLYRFLYVSVPLYPEYFPDIEADVYLEQPKPIFSDYRQNG